MATKGRPREKEEKRKQVSFRLPEDLVLKLQHYALDEKESLSDILGEVVTKWWDENPKRKDYETKAA